MPSAIGLSALTWTHGLFLFIFSVSGQIVASLDVNTATSLSLSIWGIAIL